MSHEEIFNDVKKEIESNEFQVEKESKKSPFLAILISLIIVILLLISVVPLYSLKFDPNPRNIPQLSDVITDYKEVNNTLHKISSYSDYSNLLNPELPFVKQTAVKISTQSCDRSSIGSDRIKLCQAKAIYLFVRDNIQYIDDPVFPADDYVETAEEVLYTGGSDCDGMAVLLANLEASIGVPVKFIFIPNHVYIWIYIEDAPGKYFIDKKDNFGWIRLDATCKDCDFGEIPAENVKKETIIV